MNQAEKIPVTLLSGFLGSGKTTLLNHLLQQAPNTAVLMNEFGEIALDHQLVETNSSTVALLSGGCVCCQIQGSLSPTLKNLYMGRRDGSVPNYQRLIIETTGLADPTPIIATLTREYWVASKYRLDAVVTLVDAQFGEQQLNEHFEAVRQAACADLILVSKSDLVEESELRQLQQRLYRLNPQVEVEMVSHGKIDSNLIFNRETQRHKETAKSLSAVISQAGTTLQPITPTGLSPAPQTMSESPHDDKIRSISLTLEKPLSRWGVSEALSLLMRFNTDSLLRVKGIVQIEDEENPLVINGVHHQLYEPYSLDGWPDEQRLSRLVFIVADADQALLNESLDKYTAVARSDADEAERNAFEVWLVQKQLQQLLNPSPKSQPAQSG